jgi:penicillin amidase
VLPAYRDLAGARASIDMGVSGTSPSSNNWAIGSKLTGTGTAIMVDDPHRQVTNPAHRYLLHLNAPGWSVAGATEAPLPGVIRGHNGRVAWGRTATETDQADVYVETINPANANEVLFQGKWEPLRGVTEEIRVKGAPSQTVELRFSRHGPIFYEDRAHHVAYALRSQLSERGTAEYLGGLRLDQATTARDCLTAANFMPMPPTNLVCADADGNIAFRVAVFAPARKGWSGRLPCPERAPTSGTLSRARICHPSTTPIAATSPPRTTTRIRGTSRRPTRITPPATATAATSASSR